MSSTIQVYSQAISDFKRLQDILDKTQSKISATSLASTFSELGTNSTNVQNYQIAINRSDRYISSIQDAERKNNQYDSSLSQLIDLAGTFQNNLALENNSTTAGVNDLTSQADTALDSIRAALNSQDGTNYIFSGSKTNVQPVADLKSTNNISDGQATSSYYSGDDFQTTVNISSSAQVKYGIAGSDPAFQKLIGAINLAKSAEAGSGDYTAAGKMLTDAISSLTALRTKVGDNETTLESSVDSHTTAKGVFQQSLSDLNSPDVVQLTIQSTEAQTALQASFQVFSKISQLSLANYLPSS